jgi:hypothetical protein
MPGARSSREERRAAVRHVRRTESSGCAVEAPEKQERWPVEIRDVSATGVSVRIARHFEVGTQLELEVEAPGRAAPRFFTMRVVRVVSSGPENFLLGCALENRLQRGELKALL